MVWVSLTRTGTFLGPHFVQENLDTREYLQIIRYNVVQSDFPINDIDRNVMFWQQDGAPSHTSNATMQYLRGQFPGRVISKRGDWPWPPRSPDLTVSDFFLWWYLKQKIWNVPHDEQPNNLRQFFHYHILACTLFKFGNKYIIKLFSPCLSAYSTTVYFSTNTKIVIFFSI